MTTSILITSFNSADHLGEVEASLAGQTVSPAQIIVSDASSDDSPNFLKEWAAREPRLTPIFGSNKGQLGNILAGLEHALGEYVFFLDGDDYYDPNHVESMLSHWRGNPQADVIYCRHRLVGDPDMVSALRRKQNHENAHWMGPIDLEAPYDWGYGTALAWCLPSYHAGSVSSCLAFRREHLMRLPLQQLCDAFDGELLANADYMILLASALYGGRKLYAPERTVNYRVRRDSFTGKYATGDAEADYRQRYYCALARNWLCSSPRFGPALRDILHKELATVPNPSRGHRRLYAKAKRASR